MRVFDIFSSCEWEVLTNHETISNYSSFNTGIYSLLSTIFEGFGKTTLVGTLSALWAISMVLTALIIFIKCILENR